MLTTNKKCTASKNEDNNNKKNRDMVSASYKMYKFFRDREHGVYFE
jgi:hypothetical protein